jgi:tetratricopeptide (TPR) repeat protein
VTRERPADPASTVEHAPSTQPEAGQPSVALPEVPGYEITGEIARGGMGVVLAARDGVFDREVAIKVLREGQDPASAAARFVRESKITARLPHPAIPPVHALGTLSSGLPFLVMKRIRGRTLAELLSQRPSPEHELARFLHIFEQVAQAVGFAHAQGIVHRDLKPANIMVGEFGEVQVMDWGVARELAQGGANAADWPETLAGPPSETLPSELGQLPSAETAAGTVLGTPSFMAPEQARGERVDARADVFALGAILCVILTGKPPFHGGKTVIDTIRLAASGDITGAVQRLDACGADAELIALTKRCLAPCMEERFPEGRAVAAAVAEYREGVEGRLRRADAERSAALAREAEQRKRRKLVQWAAGLGAAVLTLGIVGTTFGMVRAVSARAAEAEQKQKALAAAQAEKAANAHTRQTQQILLNIFADLELRKVQAEVIPLEQVLAGRLVKAGAQLNAHADRDPLALAELQNQLALSLLGLGFHKQALPLARQSVRTRTTLLGANHPATLDSRNSVAVCHYLDGKYDLAEGMYEAILRQRKQVLGSDHRATLLSMSNLGDCYRAAGKNDRAIPLYREALKRRRATLGLRHADTLTSMNNLAAAYQFIGEYKQALPLFEEAFKRRQALLGPGHLDTLVSLGNLAHCYSTLDQHDRALPLLQQAMTRMKERFGVDHPSTLTSMSNLALGYHSAGLFDKALPLMEETLRLSRSKLGADHPDTLVNLGNLASCYLAVKRVDRAIPLYEETLKLQTARLGADHPHTLLAMNNLARGYQSLGKLDLAIPLYEKALERMQAKQKANNNDSIGLMTNLGLAYRAAGKPERAVALLEQVLAFRKARQGANHPLTLASLTNLAEAHVDNRQGAKAVPLYEEFLNRKRQQAKPDDPFFAGYLLQIAPQLMRGNQFVAAEKHFREALGILDKLAPTAWATADTRSQLGGALLRQRKYAEARPLLLAGYEGLCKARQKPASARVNLVAALDRLIRLSEALELPEEVRKWQAEKQRLIAPPPDKESK